MDMHKQNLTMAMMDVWSYARADINIMDAHRAASGYSPHMPVPIESHMILGSKDPGSHRQSCLRGHRHRHDGGGLLQGGRGDRLGNYDMDQIEVVGNTIEESFMKMWIPLYRRYEHQMAGVRREMQGEAVPAVRLCWQSTWKS